MSFVVDHGDFHVAGALEEVYVAAADVGHCDKHGFGLAAAEVSCQCFDFGEGEDVGGAGFAGDEDGDFAVDGDYVDFVNGVDALDGGYVPVGFYADLYVLEVSAVAGGYVYVEFEDAAGVDEAVADYGVFVAEGDGSACGAQVF